uniref:Uncharacterized protein n=1 Tax=Oryza nivara TaxID=4536 RepID=A0A0E0J4Q7_ORYNI
MEAITSRPKRFWPLGQEVASSQAQHGDGDGVGSNKMWASIFLVRLIDAKCFSLENFYHVWGPLRPW